MITATHINYYHLCHRKLWLFANSINMEQTSSLVAEGKLIHEKSYQQRAEKSRELAIGGIKIDYYDAKNRVVREVKKSDKLEHAHIAQLKYYLFVLEENGLEGVTGVLEYPTLKKRKIVVLTAEDRKEILYWLAGVKEIVEAERCPKVVKKPYCKKCAYYEFCFV